MLAGLLRWFRQRRASPAAAQESVPDSGDAGGLAEWADRRQFEFRGDPTAAFLIDGRLGALPWRLEWGPSQRPYIEGQELRLRSEMGLPGDLQIVVLNRKLHAAMEESVYAQYVDGVQTRIDRQTPPEMRWLVMFPRLDPAQLGPLHPAWVALGSHSRWLRRWLEGPMSDMLQSLAHDAERPLVFVIGRGRLMLRTALPDAAAAAVPQWATIFETAMRQARRATLDHPEMMVPGTHAEQWQPTVPPSRARPRADEPTTPTGS